MATNDESMATKVEQWIVDRIGALAAFDADKVTVWEGEDPTAGGMIEQLMAKASASKAYIAVMYEGDIPIPLEEGAQAYEPTYAILAVVKNERGGAARHGDGTYIGTNKIRDLLRTSLHEAKPAITAGGFYAEQLIFRGSRLVHQQKGVFILRTEVVLRETEPS